MPTLRTFANLWTLRGHPGNGDAEWPLPLKISAIAKAGFDGVMDEPGQGTGALALASGMRFIAFRRLDARHNFQEVLKHCRDEGAMVMQVHLGRHDTPADEALALALSLVAESDASGVEVVIETHRDTCTETPEKTEKLRRDFHEASGGRELPLLLDFSHYAVVKHLDPPFAPRLLADGGLVRQARWHHLRPFNGHHAQIPVLAHNGLLTPEVMDWFVFVDEVFRLLHASSLPEIWICPEIGPVEGGYGLSTFPPAWETAVTLLKMLRQRWGAANGG